MTRHRSREAWRFEILEAARCEIDENGYAGFSMESIVRRTGLSRGGVYRFFSNRTDVALEIFTRLYRTQLQFDLDECLSWNLPIAETVFRLFTRYATPEEGARREDRIWVKLLPEVLNDSRFADNRADVIREISGRLLDLARVLGRRDGIVFPENFDVRVPDAIAVGLSLMEGFAVQSALGGSIAQQGRLVRNAVERIVADLLSRQS